MDFPKVNVVSTSQTALVIEVLTGPYLPYCRHFLVGQDSSVGGQPFITQVPKKVQTVEDAFAFLMPKPVKQAIERGLAVKRQGDWFLCPARRRMVNRVTCNSRRTNRGGLALD